MPEPSVTRTLFVVEGSSPPARCQNGVVAHWSTLTTTDKSFSIPAIVERTGIELRGEYLAWVHDMGNEPVQGTTLRDFLFFEDPDLSAWWLNSISDKSPLVSTAIYEVFKLRALEKLYVEQACTGLVFCGHDRRLHRALKALGRSFGHPYRWSRTERLAVHLVRQFVNQWVRALPYLIQAMGYLSWVVWTRYLPMWMRGHGVPTADQRTDHALIVTYFPNIDLTEARKGHFQSTYWGPLHDVIDELPIAPTWVWIHGDTAECDFGGALSWRDLFNKHPTRLDRHFLLEDFVTLGVLLAAIRAYVKIYVRGLALTPLRHRFVLANSTACFYPLLEREWKTSLFGTSAIRGQLFRALFDSMMAQLPTFRWGIYLWEGQPWESAFLAAWRHQQNGPVFGHQHATLPPLDLRGINDPRTYRELGRSARPAPDILAVNGRGALDQLREMQYPEEQVALVEALRYPRLSRQIRHVDAHRTLLVIGGLLESEALQMVDVLNEAAESILRAGYSRIRIKPHPFSSTEMLSPDLAPMLEFEIVHEPLERLWPDAGFALIANSTSAAVEALYAGVPIAICNSADNLNLSPLYGHPAVPFISTGPELTTALAAPRCALLPADYFLISEQPNRWKDLLLRAAPTTRAIPPQSPD